MARRKNQLGCRQSSTPQIDDFLRAPAPWKTEWPEIPLYQRYFLKPPFKDEELGAELASAYRDIPQEIRRVTLKEYLNTRRMEKAEMEQKFPGRAPWRKTDIYPADPEYRMRVIGIEIRTLERLLKAEYERENRAKVIPPRPRQLWPDPITPMPAKTSPKVMREAAEAAEALLNDERSELATDTVAAVGTAPDAPEHASQASERMRVVQQRAKRRQEAIYPQWEKAEPPITSCANWAARASEYTSDGRAIDGNTARDYMNGKTVRLQPKSEIPLAKALNKKRLESDD
jgi:hypothetical protein